LKGEWMDNKIYKHEESKRSISSSKRKNKNLHPWISRKWKTPIGSAPVISHQITLRDRWGSWRIRWGIKRMNYRVEPGLYAIGEPDRKSPVLVTANYKMSFDCLRSQLQNIKAWILVLDTRGINVWCAAGKGTFGTTEIVQKIKEASLTEIVDHRQIIVPQLGAPGVSAHLVKKESGFKVIYGPVRAFDLPTFLNNDMKATTSMRQSQFPLKDRLVLTPMEIIGHFKYFIVLFFLVVLVSNIQTINSSIWRYLVQGLRSALLLVPAYFIGTFLTPILLPILPGRSFAFKGFFAGLSFYGFWYLAGLSFPVNNIISILSLLLIALGVSSFTAMNFTGASNYTSLSGVKKEMKFAVPLQLASISLGVIFLIISNFLTQGHRL